MAGSVILWYQGTTACSPTFAPQGPAEGVAFAETWTVRKGISLHRDDVTNGEYIADETHTPTDASENPPRRRNIWIWYPGGGVLHELVLPLEA